MFGNLAALSWYISHFQPITSTHLLAPTFHLQLGIKGSPIGLQRDPLLCFAWVNFCPVLQTFRINPSRGFIICLMSLKSVGRFSTILPCQEGTDTALRCCYLWSDFPFSILFFEHSKLSPILPLGTIFYNSVFLQISIFGLWISQLHWRLSTWMTCKRCGSR